MHKYLYSYNITILYMFRAWLREFSLNQCNVRPLTESDGTRSSTYTIGPPAL